MKIKLDLSKFKLGKNDGKMATLHHPDGHVVHIAVSALHPENRKNLAALEKHEEPKAKKMMADGGDTGSSGIMGAAMKLAPMLMADGGNVQSNQKALAAGFFGATGAKTAPAGSPAASPTPSAKPNYIYAEGGDVMARKKEVDDYNNLHEDEPKEYPQDVTVQMQKAKDMTPKRMANGGKVADSSRASMMRMQYMADGGQAQDEGEDQQFIHPSQTKDAPYPAMPAQEPIQEMTPEEHARLYPSQEQQDQEHANLQASTHAILDKQAQQMQDQAAADPDYIAHMRAAAAQYTQQKAQADRAARMQALNPNERIRQNTIEGATQAFPTESRKYAKGGNVNPKLQQSRVKFADGGDAQPDQAPVTVNVNGPQGNVSPDQFNKNVDSYKNGQTPQPQVPDSAPAQTAPQEQEAPAQQPVAQDPNASQVDPNKAMKANQVQRIGNAVMDNTAMAQMSANPNDPWGTQVTQSAMLQGINEQKQGAALAATGQAAQGQQIAQAAQANINAAVELQKANQDNFEELSGKRQDLMEDLANAHIDPNRYINNMSTGQRIMSGIGLILGGAGGNGNMALDFLNKQIDRDIMAQHAELGKKENLLSANMNDFKNFEDARDFTKVNMNDILSAQMKQQAAKFQGTQAAANLLNTAGQLDQQNSQLFGQLSMRRTLLQGGANAPGAEVPPEMKIRGLIPAGPEQDKYFTQLGQAQSTVKARDNLINAFDQVAKMQTIGNRLANPVQSKSQINALVEPLTAGLSKETAGRYTEQDANAIKTLFPTMTDNAETVAKKRAQMIKTATEKMNYPELKSIGIDTESMGNSKAMAGAPEIKTLNGVRYQKVQGGWKKI